MLNEWKYDVSLGGIDFDVSIVKKGIQVNMSGYVEHIPKLMSHLGKKLTEINLQLLKLASYPFYLLFMTIFSALMMLKIKSINGNTFKISIEASSVSGWKRIVGKDGVTLGLSTFGKSAPYKDIYKLLNLTSDEIVKIVQSKIGK